MAAENSFECPNCKKQGLVRLQSESDVFECIYCHYKDDLNGASRQGNSWFMAVVLAIFVALALTAV